MHTTKNEKEQKDVEKTTHCIGLAFKLVESVLLLPSHIYIYVALYARFSKRYFSPRGKAYYGGNM